VSSLKHFSPKQITLEHDNLPLALFKERIIKRLFHASPSLQGTSSKLGDITKENEHYQSPKVN